MFFENKHSNFIDFMDSRRTRRRDDVVMKVRWVKNLDLSTQKNNQGNVWVMFGWGTQTSLGKKYRKNHWRVSGAIQAAAKLMFPWTNRWLQRNSSEETFFSTSKTWIDSWMTFRRLFPSFFLCRTNFCLDKYLDKEKWRFFFCENLMKNYCQLKQISRECWN